LGIPFNVGVWVGPDGQSVIAALNPGTYASAILTDLSNPPPPPGATPGRREQDWVRRVQKNGDYLLIVMRSPIFQTLVTC